MKANELRIGNWVSQYGYEFQIKNANEISNLVCLEPIPLTEEWLLKFGFERYKSGDSSLGKCYSAFNVSLLVWYRQNRIEVSFWQGKGFKYIHQLQNLYFALTGEELKTIERWVE